MTALPLTARVTTLGPRREFGARPYQGAAIDAIDAYWADHPPGPDVRSPMLVMGTGLGKTKTALSIAASTIEAGGRVLWLAHRTELLTQPFRAWCSGWADLAHVAGIVQASRNAAAAQLVFGSVQTLGNKRRVAAVLAHGEFDLVVVDEAHHEPSKQHRRVVQAVTAPHTRLLALTATPDRMDGADLSDRWDIAFTYDGVQGAADGWLTEPYAAVCRLAGLDTSKVRMGRRDFDDAELGRALMMQGIVEHTVEQMGRTHLGYRLPDREASAYFNGRDLTWLVFCASVEQTKATADALRAAGWRARWADGSIGADDRRRLLAALGRGQLQVLVNCGLFGEGTDIPNVDAVALCRPTKSWPLYIQTVGRCLRLHDLDWPHAPHLMNRLHPDYRGHQAGFVLDLAGATEEHSLVAAPVLIGGDRCAESPNGVHDFRPDCAPDDVPGPGVVVENLGAVCTYCDKKRGCWAALQSGLEGHHVYTDDDPDMRRCRFCRRIQCAHADNGRHKWMPVAEGTQSECMWCEHRIPDPHAALVGGSSRLRPIDECAGLENWLGLPGLEPETFAVVVPDEGILFVGGDRHGADGAGAWIPHWLPHRARKPRRLSLAPIPTTTVRAWADDIVRRAARAKRGSEFGRITDRQREYAERLRVDTTACGSSGDLAREIDRARARERAIATGIARDAVADPNTATSDPNAATDDTDTEQQP